MCDPSDALDNVVDFGKDIVNTGVQLAKTVVKPLVRMAVPQVPTVGAPTVPGAMPSANALQASTPDEATRRQQRRPTAPQMGRAFAASTLLTGPQGVAPNLTNVARNTLLGG